MRRHFPFRAPFAIALVPLAAGCGNPFAPKVCPQWVLPGIEVEIQVWISLASSWKTDEVVRPQPGQAATRGTKVRNPMVWSSSWAVLTSSVRSPPGSGVRENRIVSPMPCWSRMPMAADEATMPFEPMPASVRPRWMA